MPKQLLPLKGSYLLEHVIRQSLTADFAQVLTVIGHEAESIQRHIRIEDRRFQWVVNPDYQTGQSSSLKLGMCAAARSHSAIMVFLGDLPFISAETVSSIIEHGRQLCSELGEPYVVRPSFNGVPAHPAFFGNIQPEMFSQLQGDQGAKPIIGCMQHRFLLPVDDAGVLLDIDTPEMYERAKRIAGDTPSAVKPWESKHMF